MGNRSRPVAGGLPDVQPLFGQPHLLVERGRRRTLAVADLHIGIERELARRGLYVPSRTASVVDAIIASGRTAEASVLVICGDLKHSIPDSGAQEEREVPGALDAILAVFSEVHLVQGNHDVDLRPLLPAGVRFHRSGGWRRDRVGYVHGHAWPTEATMRSDLLILAHNHPHVAFEDPAGARTSEPCWLRGRFAPGMADRFPDHPAAFVVLPACTIFGSGVAVNERPSALLGPLLQKGRISQRTTRVYTLDGVDLGPLGSLRSVRTRWTRGRPRASRGRRPGAGSGRSLREEPAARSAPRRA